MGLYLFAYNAFLTLAWAYVLFLTVASIMERKSSTDGMWQAVELPLQVAQGAAVLEVVHSAIGLVRSPVGVTGMQVVSRLWVLFGLIMLVPGPTTHGAINLGSITAFSVHIPLRLDLVSLLVAWSVSEVIRYSFYVCKESLGYVPYLSMWLRYSGFIVLYPLGVASELAMCYLALPTIRDKGLLSLRLPNRFNLGIDYSMVCLLICASYVPGLPTLYGYMLGQRKKVLGSKKIKIE